MSLRVIWSVIIVIFLGISIRKGQVIRTARLIWDNRIWVVPDLDGMVLSTFGLLSGGRIYVWGSGGLLGPRLKALAIDPHKICLSFGNKQNLVFFEFLHGINNKRDAVVIADKFWRETGVTAKLQGW